MATYSREYQFVRPLILFAYSSTCLLCGSTSPLLDVHHIDKNIHNNSVFNLVPLCAPCHKSTHRLGFILDVFSSHVPVNVLHQIEEFRLFYCDST